MTDEQMKAEIARLAAEVDALNKNAADLVKEKRAALTRAEKAEQDAQEAAEAARSETGSELDKANRLITKLTKERDDALSKATNSEKGLREYKASSALATAIASANVDADDVALLTKALKADIEFDDSGEPLIEGKSIDAYAKTFFSGAGKRYVRVADHSGGGATGSEGTKSGQWSKAPSTPDELEGWMKFSLDNRDEATALANQWQRADLKP